MPAPSTAWALIGGVLFLLAWALTWQARERNRQGSPASLRVCLALAALATAAGFAALMMAPWSVGLDPTVHAYPAIIWAILVWIGANVIIGVIMQLYCLARSLAGRLTPTHDQDIWNVTLFWHFLLGMALVAAATISLGPTLLRA